jgi:hypothetical protein
MMTLSFPNISRSYDDTRRQIRFVGHDGMLTIPFRVNVNAILKNATGDPEDEEIYLRSFDGIRDAIQSVAREAYSNKRQTVYVLTADDFR